jgi:hypothetical protein
LGKESILGVGEITLKDPGPKGRVKKKSSRSWLSRQAVEEMNDQAAGGTVEGLGERIDVGFGHKQPEREPGIGYAYLKFQVFRFGWGSLVGLPMV